MVTLSHREYKSQLVGCRPISFYLVSLSDHDLSRLQQRECDQADDGGSGDQERVADLSSASAPMVKVRIGHSYVLEQARLALRARCLVEGCAQSPGEL
jgi:hypothetical protein